MGSIPESRFSVSGLTADSQIYILNGKS